MFVASSHEQPSREAEIFSFLFGFALQLVDDMQVRIAIGLHICLSLFQDVLTDCRNSQHTLFTHAMSRAEAIDPLSNRLMHFLDSIIHPRHYGVLTPDITSVL